mmetsp:Transcript_10904/g.32546  ORF Transcript_10904/g.32546 Transcript_10904/m.32546 type:complete len:202 (+) Transcript_10904:225-830(+)
MRPAGEPRGVRTPGRNADPRRRRAPEKRGRFARTPGAPARAAPRARGERPLGGHAQAPEPLAPRPGARARHRARRGRRGRDRVGHRARPGGPRGHVRVLVHAGPRRAARRGRLCRRLRSRGRPRRQRVERVLAPRLARTPRPGPQKPRGGARPDAPRAGHGSRSIDGRTSRAPGPAREVPEGPPVDARGHGRVRKYARCVL